MLMFAGSNVDTITRRSPSPISQFFHFPISSRSLSCRRMSQGGTISRTTPRLSELPITALSGVGPERAQFLQKLNIRTVEELLLHRPRRYEDRCSLRSIRELE